MTDAQVAAQICVASVVPVTSSTAICSGLPVHRGRTHPRTDALQAALAVMGLAMEGTLIHAGTSDRHRRGDHTDRHHAQRIEVKRDAGAPVSLLQKRHQR
jgi:hypothetical protein